MPTTHGWIWVVIVGVLGITAHYCASKAMQTAEVSKLMAMDFLRLPLVALLGMLLYGELFDWWVVLGGGLMIIGNMIGQDVWRKRRERLAS